MNNHHKANHIQPICAKAVRNALDALLYTSVDRRGSPLEKLLLVDEFLANPDLPDTPHKREFAIHHLLTSLIVDELVRHREVYDFKPPDIQCTMASANSEIAQDALTNNQELIGWSWLYYHYVRVDLNITPSDFSELALIDRRTLRRYQLHTIKRLTQRLYDMEWKISEKYRQRRLATELPVMIPIPLFGRENESQRVLHMLANLRPAHIQITGEYGIGKSTFAQEIIRQQIENQRVDYLIWLNHPRSIKEIREILATRLNYEATNSTLRHYLTEKRIVIVVDDGKELVKQTDALADLLDDLSAGTVFLINHHYHFLRNIKGHISLKELSDDATELLIRDSVARNFHGEAGSISQGDIQAIQASANGHPMAIMEAIHALYLPHKP